MKHHLCYLGFTLLLVGCSSPPVNIDYYSLSVEARVSSSEKVNDESEKKLILIENINLAEFLKQPGLVVQTHANKMHLSSQHRWAESLQQSLPRSLLAKLENRMPENRFEGPQSRYKQMPALRLSYNFSHFHSDAKLGVVAAGNLWISDSDNRLIMKKKFNIQQPLTSDGFLDAVEKLDGCLSMLANLTLQWLDDINI